MYYVGIDWADRHHDIYVTDEGGEKLMAFRIDHDPEGFQILRYSSLDVDENLEGVVLDIRRWLGLD